MGKKVWHYPKRPDAIPDNAIAKAALMIRELHEQNIDLMAGGHVFTCEGKNVNAKMWMRSLAEIDICDDIIKRSPHMAKQVMIRGATLHVELEQEIKRAREEAPAPATKQIDVVKADDVPDGIGKYEH
jgi:hypothetical protein